MLASPRCLNLVRSFVGVCGSSDGKAPAGGGKRLLVVSWRIMSVDDQNCILRIADYPHVLQNVPVAIQWLPHIVRVGPMLRTYLSSVLRGFEWYVTRGEPVPRNQFIAIKINSGLCGAGWFQRWRNLGRGRGRAGNGTQVSLVRSRP